MQTENKSQLAIRFGLGAIKAVGFAMTENIAKERKANNKFKDIYDFAERLDPKTVNKKSIEALAKAGAFDSISSNRRQIADSFDIISNHAVRVAENASSNQMSLFGLFSDSEIKPELKKVENWTKIEKLQKEFEAFGFFLNEHPIDDYVSDLKKRGVIFSDKLEKDELEDNSLVKMSGVIASSKHRSGSRGRFAYLTISDYLGIFEAMIFDENLITNARDLLNDGSMVQIDCLIKKDDGGTRILVRDVRKLEDFIKYTKPKEKDFEDIKKQPSKNRSDFRDYNRDFKQGESKNYQNNENSVKVQNEQQLYQDKINRLKERKIFSKIEIIIKERETVFNIKTFLTQRIAPSNFEKFTKVFFVVMLQDKVVKVELLEKYLLDESDIAKIRAIDKVMDVEVSF
jgi:DNA polymerase III alpha subunit